MVCRDGCSLAATGLALSLADLHAWRKENRVTLHEKISDWKNYPNALGSESQAAVIVGEVAAALGEAIPNDVRLMLKKLSLRGTMRDIASAIQRGDEHSPGVPCSHDVVDIGAESAGLSWGEAIAEITKYLDEQARLLG